MFTTTPAGCPDSFNLQEKIRAVLCGIDAQAAQLFVRGDLLDVLACLVLQELGVPGINHSGCHKLVCAAELAFKALSACVGACLERLLRDLKRDQDNRRGFTCKAIQDGSTA